MAGLLPACARVPDCDRGQDSFVHGHYGCIFLAVSPIIIGAAAKHTNFTLAGYLGSYELNDDDSPRLLPFTILYLTLDVTAIFDLVSIAVTILSSANSTVITRNIDQAILRPMAMEMEVMIALCTMICACCLSTWHYWRLPCSTCGCCTRTSSQFCSSCSPS
ncbi:hypothetical protein HPB50_010634 [Hyalomma asiaticum]|uniref:Uncharacterized protein n=1 Tax=Hyalomma asiaticum TaxID=266040 RepID=A0ACB7SJR1_HYAAI|nr:hypothetical protein HPB50_010634 [Hyalomma asiaticum]